MVNTLKNDDSRCFIMKKFLEWFICDILPGILDIIGAFLV